MSSGKNKRRQRPLQSYINAVEKLAPFDSRFHKFAGKSQFTPQEKSFIARIAHLPPTYQKMPDEYYRENVKELKKFVPSLKKYGRKKKFTGPQRAHISRFIHLTRYADHLFPVSDKDKKILKGDMFTPGVQAIQLRNTNPHAKLKIVDRDLFVTSNGRLWVYWKLNRVDERGLKDAATEIFENIQSFDFERITELARKAFDDAHAARIYLWTAQGRVGESFATLKEFLNWLATDFQRYERVEEWIKGLAFIVGEAGQRTPLEYWETTEYRREHDKELRIKRRKKNKWKKLRKERRG